MKKLDIYLLKHFLGLLVMTFLICIFILLMQFVWMHIKDLVGKGVEIKVLAEFFIYAVTSVVPLALPLAILLASLMTFGNLGEKFELTAMKAAGVSLFRIMRPLVVAIGFICVGAFLFSNYVLPVSQVKLWALVFSLKQKSPELDIPQGEFYDGIEGYNLYVRHKNPKTGMLYDMMIYDYSDGFRNASVMLADSGQIYFSADNKYLLLVLYSGEAFENLDRKQQRATSSEKNIPYRRESFASKQILIDFDMDFNRYSEDVLADQHVSKDVSKLIESIDSVKVLAHIRSNEQSEQLVNNNYFGRERVENRNVDALEGAKDLYAQYEVDSLYSRFSDDERYRAASAAVDRAKGMKDKIDYNALMLDDHQRYIRKHEIELHRKFTLAFACLIFFFIGAPLGAITRKGGLGAPVVISVVMFIVYYIIDNTGYKMAREALWPCWSGMWLSSMVLLPIGIFLTYTAATDSPLFNPEAWMKYIHKLKKIVLYIWKQLKKQSKIFAKVNS
ncbi:MAG: LptF/LptG family permease [Paludibacteraceae bacterium]|nr:LptF/LptG family permease [Paludibacteraceae bacterium]